jgi:hypothetical protein
VSAVPDQGNPCARAWPGGLFPRRHLARWTAIESESGVGTSERESAPCALTSCSGCEPERRIELLTYALRAWSMTNMRTMMDGGGQVSGANSQRRLATYGGGRAMDARCASARARCRRTLWVSGTSSDACSDDRGCGRAAMRERWLSSDSQCEWLKTSDKRILR